MTYEEYRQHMRKHSRDTMVMSFVVMDHPDYKALQAAGDEIIPYLLTDLLDPDWHCTHCYGEGFEFPAGWVWDNVKRNWPTDTGIPCSECKGKGSINTHACMTLLFEKTRARGDAPVIEDWMRGRMDALGNLWRKWGEKNGLLPSTPDAPTRNLLTRLLGLFNLGKEGKNA